MIKQGLREKITFPIKEDEKMALYTGLKCLSCGEVFKEDDDIVVCPDCGTPYHRACYKKNGKCINDELHEKKGSFSAAAERAKSIGASIKCEYCGADNPSLSIFCEQCGKPIVVGSERVGSHEETRGASDAKTTDFSFDTFIINYDDKLCGLNPDEEFDGVKTSELADFVGSNTYYFLPVFKLMKERKRKATFNLPAMIFPTEYFAYRKMWGMMLLSFIVKTLIMLPSLAFSLADMIARVNMPDNFMVNFIKSIDFNGALFGTLYNCSIFANYIVLFLFGVFTNWIYYKHCVKKIKKLKAKNKCTPKELERVGGGSAPAVILILTATFLLGCAMALAFITP